jgi:hypothetical protein
MIVAMTDTSAESIWARWTHHLVEVATVLGWILVACLIAASYVGHSFSPYGTCYAKSGRSVQCLAGRR